MNKFKIAHARFAAAAVGLLLLGHGAAAPAVVLPGPGQYRCEGTGRCVIGPVRISGPASCSLVTRLERPGTQTLQIDTLRQVSRLPPGSSAMHFGLRPGSHRVSVRISTFGHVRATLECRRR